MNKKIALVTGANKGIGFEICRQLGQAGFTVVLTARDIARGTKAAHELQQEGLKVEFQQMDVTDEASIKRVTEYIGKQYHKLDVLVNNAGIIVNSKDSTRASTDDLRKTFETNFFGAYTLSQAVLPLLKGSDDARIINISSGMGAMDEMSGGHVAYRTSKSALNSLTAVMAADLAGTRIRVNAMCPGWVRTDMGGKGALRSPEEGADTALWLATEKKIPTGRFFRDRKPISW